MIIPDKETFKFIIKLFILLGTLIFCIYRYLKINAEIEYLKSLKEENKEDD